MENNNKQVLTEEQMNNIRKKMKMLAEYSYITEEDPNDMNMQQPADNGMDAQQQPPMDNGMGQQPMDNGMAQQPDMNGGDMMNNQQPMGDQQMNQPMDNGMGQQPMDNGMAQQPMEQQPMDNFSEEGIEDINVDDTSMTEPMQPEDEVIDVDDLTQSQETTEYKIDGVNDKLSALLDVTAKFAEALKQNDEKIEDLKKEIEKRNPTEEEQMNLRSLVSEPYTSSPVEFWNNRDQNRPGYKIVSDNDIPTNEEEYVLTKDDLKGDNENDIYKTMEYPQSLKDILDF